MIRTRLKLGWRVLGRALLFGFALAIVMFLLRLCLMLAITPEIVLPEHLGKPVALVLAVLIVGVVLPLGMFWAANWTGYLQGSDKKEFNRLKSEQDKCSVRGRPRR